MRVTTETVRIDRYTQIFDTPLPADPEQASVVQGFRTAMILWDKSSETMRLVSPVTAYVTERALRNLKASLAHADTGAGKVVPGGTDRFFKTRVTVMSGTSATIATCDDGSQFEEVNPSTGVPDPAFSPPANQQYLFETWQMVRLGGHWAISVVSPVTLPDSRAKPCQPLPARPPRRRISWPMTSWSPEPHRFVRWAGAYRGIVGYVPVVVGACDVVTGAALRPAARAGRMILIAGAVAGMLVAANPAHAGGGSVAHGVWAALGFAGLTAWPLGAWPLGAWRRGQSVPWGLRPGICFAAVAVQLILLAWFLAELVSGAAQVGLAERVVGAAQAIWPFAVIVSCRAGTASLVWVSGRG